jgi:hypothetical protein
MARMQAKVEYVEHFWLCGDCSSKFAFCGDLNGTVSLTPKPIDKTIVSDDLQIYEYEAA